MQTTRELFEILALMNLGERDSYILAHPDLPSETVEETQQLLAAEDSSTALPAVDLLCPAAEQRQSVDLQPGDWLGPYRLVRRMGSGGMGVVYEAVHEEGEIRLRVAIKVLHSELCTPEFLLQLRQEAAKLTQLRHPNIVRLLDWKLEQTGTPYCVLEYTEGENIIAWCHHHELTRQARLQLFLDACAAVAFAHRNLIAHLDLKPENILVNTYDGVRLVDFGISRTLTEESVMDGTQPLTYSARYASPEQKQGRQLSALSDIYSLGIVLRELLSLPDATDKKSAANQPLPYELEAIAARASATEMESRYATVEEFQLDLRNYLAQRPVSAVPQSPLYLARQFCRRNARRLAVAIVMLTALLAALSAWQAHRRADREHLRTEKLRRSVQQLSGTLLSPLEEEMRDLPGSTPARILAVNAGLQFLQNLSSEEGNDPNLKMEIAKAYLKLGDLQGNPTIANLGDFKGARTSYESALRLAANCRNQECRYTSGMVLIHEADLVGEEGDNRAAAQMYEKAVDIFRDLTHATQGEARMRDGLGIALSDLADHQLADGRSDLARANYDQALELARQLVQQQPDNVHNLRLLGRILSRQGELEWDTGHWQQAYVAYRAGLDIADRLLLLQPDNYRVRRFWIARANDLAADEENLHREAEALDLYLRTETLATRNAEIDPRDTVAIRDQQIGYSDMTRVYLYLNQLANAEKSCLRGLALAKTLWKLNPQDATAKDDLSGFEEQMAELHGKKHEYAAAIASEEEALQLLRANFESNDSTAGMVEMMAGLVRLANYNLDFGVADPTKAETARQAVTKSLAELHRLKPRLRPGYADDKECAVEIRKLEARLRSQSH